jgi:hypothetical protein
MATPITQQDFEALSFGYINGQDLCMFCAFQFLQRQYQTAPDIIQRGCTMATKEIAAKYGMLYDLTGEFLKRGSSRDEVNVKRVTIKAIENILGSNQYLNERMKDMIAENNKEIKSIKIQDTSLTATQTDLSNPSIGSTTELIKDNFSFLG